MKLSKYFFLLLLISITSSLYAQLKPNIVYIYADDLGYGVLLRLFSPQENRGSQGLPFPGLPSAPAIHRGVAPIQKKAPVLSCGNEMIPRWFHTLGFLRLLQPDGYKLNWESGDGKPMPIQRKSAGISCQTCYCAFLLL